ncbi:MAG TPA: hypothetical protein VGH98_00445 [Gemmatimonadaceae bacterium]
MDRLRQFATLALLLPAAACRRGASEQSYADHVKEDIPRIEKAVGVRFKQPPKFEVKSRAQVRAFLLAQLSDSATQRDLAGKEAAYKLLGLIPDTMNVRKLLVDLLTEQILGFYDPKTKVLYIMNGAPDDVVGVTIYHELVHALQDQYFNLDSLQHQSGDDDRQTAAQAVIEGEATYEQMTWMLGARASLATQLPGGQDRMRDLIRDSQSSPIFSAAPMVIQEELLFPYINGAEFVRRFKEHEPGRLPFQDMPQSTEQVMHDRAFFTTPRDAPIRITVPRIPGTIYENTLGEFDTRLFLFEHLGDQDVASRAAIGWGGDRYAIVHTSGGNGLAWVSAWDSAIDAAEFVNALGEAFEKRYRAPAAKSGAGGVRTYNGSGRTVVVTPREIDGRNVVLVVDVPTGTSTQLVDLARLTLGG